MNFSFPIFCILIAQSFSVFAQAPKLQSESIWAKSIKIDGNINEWQSPLKGYDKKTKIAYSIANDDKHIYLVIKTSNSNKARAGGITFGINTKEVSFPYNPARELFKYVSNTANKNRKFLNKPEDFKQIELSGFKTINKSVISIYNEYGIRAAIVEDEQKNYTYELAVPMKLFDLNPDQTTSFEYIIKLRGIVVPEINGKLVRKEGRSRKMEQELEEQMADFKRPTQFAGKYKLALK